MKHKRIYNRVMKRKRIYNRVIDDDCGYCQLGELLTDKELERIHNCKRDWPNTAKVKVREIYYFFGARFADNYELIKQGE